MNGREKGKVLVAMSGGVDSSVACAALKEAGFEVAAAFMRFASPDALESDGARKQLSDVQKVANLLDVELHILDYSWEIQQIIDYFVYEYSVGRTPNPCARCNATLKFGKLLAFARQLGADYLATGHYARILAENNRFRLARALARDKDQSYVLFGIRRADLPSILFPNGEAPGKEHIRQKARELHLPTHDKDDSQEICFIPDNDYVRFLAQHRPELNRPGPIIDPSGKVVGEHQGVFRYTIGQRRGLNIAAGEPLYVVKIDPLANTVVVGPREALAKRALLAGELNWHVDRPKEAVKVNAQIRYTHQAAPAQVEILDTDRIKITFGKPQYAITAGQAVVLYQDDLVMAGGWILPDETV